MVSRKRKPLPVAAFLCLWLGLLAGRSVRAEAYTGIVVGVPDGNTLDVRDARGRVRRVQLAGVRAPIRGQPFAVTSRASLAHLAAHRRIWVDWYRRSGECRHPAFPGACRLVGKAFLLGTDLGLKQLERGLAWHDVRQLGDQSLADRGLYSETEEHARIERRGLWVDSRAVAPWLWRGTPPALARRPRRDRDRTQ
jgi:endonuclease YncB( thermonuclease family)